MTESLKSLLRRDNKDKHAENIASMNESSRRKGGVLRRSRWWRLTSGSEGNFQWSRASFLGKMQSFHLRNWKIWRSGGMKRRLWMMRM
jgi:hypothetical protein